MKLLQLILKKKQVIHIDKIILCLYYLFVFQYIANAVMKSIDRHMQLALKLKEANNINWWKIHESCLLAISSVKPILQELSASNFLELDLNTFVNQFVIGLTILIFQILI